MHVYKTENESGQIVNRFDARLLRGIVHIVAEMSGYSVATGAWRKITTLPAGMAPSSNTYFKGVPADICADTYGVVWARSSTDISGFSCSACWPAR